ncbi:RNA polymerase sigma factor [Elusimicrobiota bacterium]
MRKKKANLGRLESLLVSKSKKGDVDAFTELIKKYEGKIWGLLRNVCSTVPSEIEDVYQETFINAFKNIKKFRETSNFGTWVYRIAANQCFMKLRKKKRSKVESLDAHLESDIHRHAMLRKLADSSRLPEKEAGKQEVQDKVRKALSKLPREYKIVVTMRDIDGLTNEEAAKALKMSIAAIKSRLHRGRTLMRNSLSDFMENGAKR